MEGFLIPQFHVFFGDGGEEEGESSAISKSLFPQAPSACFLPSFCATSTNFYFWKNKPEQMAINTGRLRGETAGSAPDPGGDSPDTSETLGPISPQWETRTVVGDVDRGSSPIR